MFTGIIKEIGSISRIEKKGGIISVTINAKDSARGLNVGDSVAINGACLTAVKVTQSAVTFDVMEETARRSTTAHLKEGDSVNLEGSMRADGTFGGHFVQGHIDCVGIINAIGRKDGNFSIKIGLPEGFENLYVDKGSIAIDGVSLTIGAAEENGVEVYVIPHTLKATTLGAKKAGDKVNVEFDVIGKYIARTENGRQRTEVTEKFLKDKGFY